MIEVCLFGRLRHYAVTGEPGGPAIVYISSDAARTVGQAVGAVGVPAQEVVNVFRNGRLARWEERMADGDRLGVFGKDMAALYV